MKAGPSAVRWLATGLAVLAGLALLVGVVLVLLFRAMNPASQASQNQNQAALTTSNNSNATVSPPSSVAPDGTPDEAQLQQTINRYLAGVAKVSDAREEDKSLRKIISGDLDSDGDNDTVVQFVLTPNAGNNGAVCIAVFINDGGKFKGVTDEVVGGNHLRDFEMESVQPGRIVATTFECPGDEYPCENERKRQTVILWENSKLVLPSHWITWTG